MTGPSADDWPADTADLRIGVAVSDALLALLPLVGRWRGTGNGVSPDGAPFRYEQRVEFVHDGRPFLFYESRTRLVDESGAGIRQAWRESGFWRPGAGPDDIEVLLAANTGLVLMCTGVVGDQRWELRTRSIVSAPTAKVVDEERRLYALLGDELVYVTELAPAGRPLAPHLNARLQRAAE